MPSFFAHRIKVHGANHLNTNYFLSTSLCPVVNSEKLKIKSPFGALYRILDVSQGRIRSSSSRADLLQQVVKFSYGQRFRNKALEAWLFIQALDFKIFVC